jgi:hypothetical protein
MILQIQQWLPEARNALRVRNEFVKAERLCSRRIALI